MRTSYNNFVLFEQVPNLSTNGQVRISAACLITFSLHKSKSIVVCLRAASSTNFASTLSWPSKACGTEKKREKEKRCYYEAKKHLTDH